MSKEAFRDLMKDERSGGEVTPPGLLNSKFFTDIGKEAKHQLEAGSHELAAVLFRGDAFVMYGKAGHEDAQHGLPEQATQQPEIERDGREM